VRYKREIDHFNKLMTHKAYFIYIYQINIILLYYNETFFELMKIDELSLKHKKKHKYKYIYLVAKSILS